jgi:hypothetical protein
MKDMEKRGGSSPLGAFVCLAGSVSCAAMFGRAGSHEKQSSSLDDP